MSEHSRKLTTRARWECFGQQVRWSLGRRLLARWGRTLRPLLGTGGAFSEGGAKNLLGTFLESSWNFLFLGTFFLGAFLEPFRMRFLARCRGAVGRYRSVFWSFSFNSISTIQQQNWKLRHLEPPGTRCKLYANSSANSSGNCLC